MDETRTEHLVDLRTLGAGAVDEMFGAELKAVLENIRDPNTEPTAKRKIVLEFTLIPDKDRERVMTLISARSVFAATKPAGDVMFVGKHEGDVVATVMHGPLGEADPRQGVFPLQRKVEGNAE